MIYLKQPLKPVNHGTLFSTLLETMEIKEPWDDDVLISHFFLGHYHLLLLDVLLADQCKPSFTRYDENENYSLSLPNTFKPGAGSMGGNKKILIEKTHYNVPYNSCLEKYA